jgi:hypothetical protein
MLSTSTNSSQSTVNSQQSTVNAAPVLSVQGDNPAHIEVGSSYNDLGASITGPQADLNLGIHVTVDGGATTTPDQIQIDTSASGTHTIIYSATDQSGLTGYASRTVMVDTASSTDATSTPSTP